MIDIKRMTQEELDGYVQTLARGKQFTTASELIQQWIFWDDMKKELLEIVHWEHPVDPDGDISGEEVGRGDMAAEMGARMVSEFGDWGPNVGNTDRHELEEDTDA